MISSSSQKETSQKETSLRSKLYAILKKHQYLESAASVSALTSEIGSFKPKKTKEYCAVSIDDMKYSVVDSAFAASRNSNYINKFKMLREE